MIKPVKLFSVFLSAMMLAVMVNSSTSLASIFGKWPAISDPPQSKVAWVAENMTQNGVPMKIKNFTSTLNTKSIVDFYVSQWSKNSKLKPAVNKAGEWTIVGIIDGDYVLTVQTKKNKQGSEGFMAVSSILAAAKANTIRSDTRFPRLPGTKMISDTRSLDSNRVGKTLILNNDHSVRSNGSFYLNTLKEKGWVVDPIAKKAYNSAVNKAYLYFRRKNESCTITITRLQKAIGSSVIVNLSTTSV
jgi:hypothetical protein